MPSDPSFSDLMARLQSGDNEAASKVFHRFASQLIALAYEKLDARTRQKLDAEDVVQSVFRSFFRHQAAGEFARLESWGNLSSLLVLMTLRKCHRQRVRFHAQRRDVRKEVRLAPTKDSATGWDICDRDREPTPDEAAMLAETIDELLKEFKGRTLQILLLLWADYSAREISFRIGCTERTVHRIYGHVKQWLARRADE